MKYTRFLIIILLLSGNLFAQKLLTLEDAISLALEKNHQIQVARNTAKITENNANIGSAGFLPQVDFTSTATYSDGISQLGIQSEITQNVAQLEASINIFNGFNDYLTYRKLKAQSENGMLSMRNSIETTLVQVVTAYYADAAAEDGRDIAREALEISRERYQRARTKAEFGQANKLDLLNALVDLNSDSISFLNAKQQLAVARENLKVLLDLDNNYDFSVEKKVQFSPLQAEQDLFNSAIQNNSDYLIATQNLKESELDYKKSMAAYMPRLNLKTTYGYRQYADGLAIETDDLKKNVTGVLSLSFNLFNGFQNHVQNQNARITLDNRQLLRDLAKLNLEKEVTNSYSNYQNKRAILEMTIKNMESSELNFKRTEELYNLGQLTNTQFREAQLNLIQSRYNLSQAKYEAKNAEISLMQLSGKLVK